MGINIINGLEVVNAEVVNIGTSLTVPKLDVVISSLTSGPNTRVVTGPFSTTPGNYLALANVPSGVWRFDWQCQVGSGSTQSANVDVSMSFSLLKNAVVVSTHTLFIDAELGQEIAGNFYINPVTLPVNGGGIESSDGTDDFYLSWTRASSNWAVDNGYFSAFRIGTL